MKPHELDMISLIAGLAFLVIGIGHLLGIDVSALVSSTTVPLLLLVAGGILLVQVTRRTRDR